MAASLRGHQVALKLYVNGKETARIPVTKFSFSQDSSFSRSFYVGAPTAEGDQSIEGWSGSLDVEVKDAVIDDMINSVIAGNQNGLGVDEIVIGYSEFYADGTVASYTFADVQLKMSTSVGGLGEKVTKKLDWQASVRTKAV